METRLLIAFGLMGVVLLVTPYIFKQPTPPPNANKDGKDKAAVAAVKDATPAPQKTEAAATPQGAQAADAEETRTVETDLYRVIFSNRGAVVKSWVLKAFKDHNNKPLDLVNQAAIGKHPAPFSVYFKTGAPEADPNAALYVVRPDGPLGLHFEYSDGHVAIQKTFQFDQGSYLVNVSSQASRDGLPIAHALAWRGGFGDETIVNATSTQKALRYDTSASKLTEEDPKVAKDAPVSVSGSYSFVGLEDNYFAGVFLPAAKTSIEVTTFADKLNNADNKEELRVGAAAGGEANNRFRFYLGPKDQDLLRKVDPKLEQLIDWGWFEVIAKPLFYALRWTVETITHNYGWAIILVTIVINMVLFPLRLSSMKSSKKMQAIQPQVAAINAKYKNLKMNDPKKSEQNEELMALYKKHDINPVGGCVPMLLQIPFFIAYYKVLTVTIAMRGASWLWVNDLSQPETIAIRILPILLVVTQFLSQRMTPSPGADPSQQKMMMFMPLFLGYIFYYNSSGLVLYWLTGNVVGIIQQLALNRVSKPAGVIDVKPVQSKKNRN